MKDRFAIRQQNPNLNFKLLYVLFLFVCVFNKSFAQYRHLTPNAEISVLTMGPGNNLNDAFGHSAYRVKDNTIDIVFNYGVFDFKTPNFYTKFAQGKLNYKIDANNYNTFENHYIKQNRTIKEQVLNLTQQEKQQVFNFLSNNYEPENQYYLYDFFYDNCATKIKDVLVFALNDKVEFNQPESFQNKTLRKLIQDELNWNSWGSVGIDLALGSVIDKEATTEEHMFLPENIYSFFEAATFNNSEKKLVNKDSIIFNQKVITTPNYFLISPVVIFGLLGLLIIYFTYKDHKQNKRNKFLDVSIFVVTGIIGIIILLLWFATDHSATAHNYNLLWAFALNLFVVVQVVKNNPKGWFVRYLKFLLIMICLMVFHWIIGIQGFAFAISPIIIALFIRYLYLIKYYKSITDL